MRADEIRKRKLLADYAFRFGTKIFVETGTYKGDTVKYMLQSGLFDHIYSMDIYEDRATHSQKRFALFPNVTIYHGDSSNVLPDLVPKLDKPTLFWLDAHHSGKQIARVKGLIETPILAELECVLGHNEHDVILIDDARYYEEFSKRYDNYPSTEQLKEMVTKHRRNWIWHNADDIIRCHRDLGD